MKSLIQTTAYVLLPSVFLWWFLNSSRPQQVNRLNSEQVRALQHYDEKVQAEAVAIWNRIENYITQHNLESTVRLNPPATADEIAALERKLGYRLPAQLKASFLVHNGSDGDFFSDYKILTTQFSAYSWGINAYYSGDFAQHEIHPNPKKVMSYYWHPGWVPAAGWDVYEVFVNLEDGRVYSFDEANAEYDASSWYAWLITVADRLEAGEIRSPKHEALPWERNFAYETPGSERKR